MRPRVVAADERRPHLPKLQDRALGSGPKAWSVATLVAIPRPDETALASPGPLFCTAPSGLLTTIGDSRCRGRGILRARYDDV